MSISEKDQAASTSSSSFKTSARIGRQGPWFSVVVEGRAGSDGDADDVEQEVTEVFESLRGASPSRSLRLLVMLLDLNSLTLSRFASLPARRHSPILLPLTHSHPTSKPPSLIHVLVPTRQRSVPPFLRDFTTFSSVCRRSSPTGSTRAPRGLGLRSNRFGKA